MEDVPERRIHSPDSGNAPTFAPPPGPQEEMRDDHVPAPRFSDSGGWQEYARRWKSPGPADPAPRVEPDQLVLEAKKNMPKRGSHSPDSGDTQAPTPDSGDPMALTSAQPPLQGLQEKMRDDHVPDSRFNHDSGWRRPGWWR